MIERLYYVTSLDLWLLYLPPLRVTIGGHVTRQCPPRPRLQLPILQGEKIMNE